MKRDCDRSMILCAFALLLAACTAKGADSNKSDATVADSMGVVATDVVKYPMREPDDLLESSGAVISPAQPDIVFTFNDSGNDAVLFAMDTSGNTRGRWAITGAANRDWEAASRGLCTNDPNAEALTSYCLYIGDVGDNGAIRPEVTLYQLPEPLLPAHVVQGHIEARSLTFRYPDQPHDVEAMYVGPDRTTYLITKRPLSTASGALRPSLVFTIPASAWEQPTNVVATLLDSLPIVPGSSRWRSITDASLSADSRLLAVRTYGQVYVFATDTLTGRVLNQVPPAICNIDGVEAKRGEGITWFGKSGALLLTNEGLDAPMHRITCPLPQR